VQPLVAAIAEALRRRQLELVGRAYSSISLPKLAELLGCSEAEASQGGLRGVGLALGPRLCGVWALLCGGLCWEAARPCTPHCHRTSNPRGPPHVLALVLIPCPCWQLQLPMAWQ